MLQGDRKAARYVRMSTDMQKYSIENQSDVIALYAAARGLTIVRSYEDVGRSGIKLDGRNALKSLIDDVRSGRADYKTVLVYDVSRWGRFQNADESAHYEFICKEAGVTVEYCAEEFENDGSLMATIVKNIKRAMAGEFSRELSKRVHAGQSRLASMGYHVGAEPGYSLRRHLLDENGNRKMPLAFHQRKSLQTERVILVPGPEEELKIVEWVYELFVDHKKSLAEIARILNSQGLENACGREWSTLSVKELLANEKYIGNCVYNRTSKKLGGKWRRNPRREWVIKSGAFEPVVSSERFEQARRQLIENIEQYSDNDLLDSLTAIWCHQHGLSRDAIDAVKIGPSPNTFRKHFGNLLNAFEKVGYGNPRNCVRSHSSKIRSDIRNTIVDGVRKLGGVVAMPPGHTCQLRINGEINVTITIGRTSPASARHSQNYWRFGYSSKQKPDMLIVARLDRGKVMDYYILPYLFLPAGAWLSVSGINYRRLEGFRTTTLRPFINLCARKATDASHEYEGSY